MSDKHIYQKFLCGDSMTDAELNQLYAETKVIADLLKNYGERFALARFEALWVAERAQNFLHARNAERERKQENERFGVYSDFSSAVQARESAEVRYGFHKNHGRKE